MPRRKDHPLPSKDIKIALTVTFPPIFSKALGYRVNLNEQPATKQEIRKALETAISSWEQTVVSDYWAFREDDGAACATCLGRGGCGDCMDEDAGGPDR